MRTTPIEPRPIIEPIPPGPRCFGAEGSAGQGGS